MKNITIIILCLSTISIATAAKRLSIQDRLTIIEDKIEQQVVNTSNSADIIMQVQKLQQQIAQLKGTIEEQNHQINNLKEKQKLLYIDIDSRLGELESKPNTTTSTTTHKSPILDTVEIDEDYSKAEVTTNTMTAQPALSNDQDDYDIAFAHLRAGRFLESARAFEGFIQKYPNNELTSNAYYWLGESYYVKRQYPQALAAFKSLTSKFPNSKKIADSWLKIGYSYYEMDDLIQAEENLKKVINSFPNTPIARLAKNRLNQMQRDH